MSRPSVKGWCPGALRPMESGDGFIIRVRPVMGALEPAQLAALCAVSQHFGAGLIDLTNRGNLQIRGIAGPDVPHAQEALGAAGLLDPDEASEARRNILVPPDWQRGDDSFRLARALTERLGELPPLPAKFGFAIDAGPAPILTGAPADLRIERAASGLILRADGQRLGTQLQEGGEIDAVMALALWFAQTGGAASARMARHRAPPGAAQGTPPLPSRAPLRPGQPLMLGDQPALSYGLAFGQIEAAALAPLASRRTLRTTPFRTIVLTGPRVDAPSLITDPGDPMLRVNACPGAPFCASASVETRALARALAPLTGGTLHVSGCAKSCAQPGAADITLTGRGGAFDLIRRGRASDPPAGTALDPSSIIALLRENDASSL
ncbi:MAG: cobalamin biosynthesis protein CobG [Paracoccus sp. (in: a-proteobacteria)]|nr:cobalamin biosynthesis protein CobG [Paracoccus sp. (in: a-proteobacteria)]